jgi:hypothetical protein
LIRGSGFGNLLYAYLAGPCWLGCWPTRCGAGGGSTRSSRSSSLRWRPGRGSNHGVVTGADPAGVTHSSVGFSCVVYRLGLSRRSRSETMSKCPPPIGPGIAPGAGPSSGYPPGRQPPRGGSAQRSRTPIVISAVLAAVVVGVAGVLIWVFAFRGSNASEPSPEDQIRALMKSVDNYLNNADAAGLASLLCDAQKTPAAATYPPTTSCASRGMWWDPRRQRSPTSISQATTPPPR